MTYIKRMSIEEKIDFFQDESFKINGRVLRALEEKGLLQCQDINHELVKKPDIAWRNGTKIVGSRIII